mgnify:CR=1 FL=1
MTRVADFDYEALNALASLAYLKPDYTFPELVTDQPETLFSAIALGHPLIAEEQRIVNDFELSQVGEVVLITGSNMSGKSTFLRTLGVNLSLAYAGKSFLELLCGMHARRVVARIVKSLSR